MNKKRLFSVVSSGILAFSSGAPSVLAGAPFVLDLLQEDDEPEYKQDVVLSDIVEVENKEIAAFLSEVYVSRNDDGNIMLSGKNSTYNIEMSLSEEEIAIEKDEAFHLIITLSNELREDQLSIKLLSDIEVIEEVLIPVRELSQIADVSTTYSETDNESRVDILEPSLDEESTEAVSDKEEESVIKFEEYGSDSEENKTDTVESKEEDLSEETTERITEDVAEEAEVLEEIEADTELVEEDEESVSYERSGEVETLLHGEKESLPILRTFSTMMSISSARTHNDGIYTIRSGDTFNAVASSFNLSTAQLREWNKHVTNINSISVGTELAVTRRGVERMLSDADKARLYKGGATSVFSNNQEFIDEIAPRAIAIANLDGQEGLWASLMIAQAAHESAYGRSSLASPPYHNLSGIKGNYNGNSTLMWTWEVYNGNRVDVLAGFRHYPSYTESLQDYANLLRRGLSWDRRYYSGTWKSNTNSVWDVLDNSGLRGYATDPKYYEGIRRIINQYDLTQYDNIQELPAADPEPEKESEPELDLHPVMYVTNSNEASFSAFLRTGYSIDTHPWGTKGFQRIGKTSEHAGQTVRVVREAQHGKYYLIELNGELLGWVDHRSVDTSARRMSNAKNVTYEAIVQNDWYSVDSLPWGTKGYFRIGNTTQHKDETITVVQETVDGKYKLIEKNGELLGWVDHRSVIDISARRISNGIDINYNVIVQDGWYSIDSLPWGTKGYIQLGNTTQYKGETVTVVQETVDGKYKLIEKNGKLLGWVDHRSVIDISARRISNGIDINYNVIVQDGWYSIDSLPWGTKGYIRIGNTTQHKGEEVTVVQKTANGNYKLIEKNGELLGWVDHRSVARAVQIGNVASSFPVDYTATIANTGFSIDSLPWGTRGFQRVDLSNAYIGTRVQVTHEAGSYVRVSVKGMPLGWVDLRALNDVPVRQDYSMAKSINYTATLESGYTIDTLPWGVSGHRRISRTRFYSGESVKVLNQTGSYALIQIRGRNIGWVDRRALVR